ncbi:expressed unknown protein [Seminavis robusta]|uniref:Uncharacterized protein n=1 Tax=Seminavis robusta TaxID=568900 RepID=A0A9N8I015_9STRA|nr:expressed unknown protein [Seminavis robusta]|eukprot:Sro3333_g346910.1 n/a (242) ;mRNA; f:1085-1889
MIRFLLSWSTLWLCVAVIEAGGFDVYYMGDASCSQGGYELHLNALSVDCGNGNGGSCSLSEGDELDISATFTTLYSFPEKFRLWAKICTPYGEIDSSGCKMITYNTLIYACDYLGGNCPYAGTYNAEATLTLSESTVEYLQDTGYESFMIVLRASASGYLSNNAYGVSCSIPLVAAYNDEDDDGNSEYYSSGSYYQVSSVGLVFVLLSLVSMYLYGGKQRRQCATQAREESDEKASEFVLS